MSEIWKWIFLGIRLGNYVVPNDKIFILFSIRQKNIFFHHQRSWSIQTSRVPPVLKSNFIHTYISNFDTFNMVNYLQWVCTFDYLFAVKNSDSFFLFLLPKYMHNGPELLNVSIRRIRLNSRFYLIKKIGVNFFY